MKKWRFLALIVTQRGNEATRIGGFQVECIKVRIAGIDCGLFPLLNKNGLCKKGDMIAFSIFPKLGSARWILRIWRERLNV